MDLTKMRELFPSTQHLTYLNHASVAPLPLPVAEAMQHYLAERSLFGSEALLEWDDRAETIRDSAARLIGAHRDEITFTGSVSHGLNIVAAGLDWKAGDNMICAETEFPANVYPWLNLRRRGVEIRFVPARDNRILVEDVASLMDERTRLVAISFVEFGTGYRNDLQGLAKICHGQGSYLCVDGIQGLGALYLSVAQTPIDFLATQAAKWMLGPVGAGFLFMRRDLQLILDPVMTGWRSVIDQGEYFRYDSPLRPSAERFEPGSLNFIGLVGMEAALKLLESVGLHEIERRILYLTDQLIAGLQDRGYSITTPIAYREERSGIICFRHSVHDSAMLLERLSQAKVIVSLRGEVIRVSPHFYNTEADIECLLDALPERGG